jgi:hypothetical protein
MVRIHRIVREDRPSKPVRTRDAVMLLHGNPDSFEFMGQWGLARDVAYTEAALTFARSVRVDTGQGNGKLHVLGFSYGA